MLCSVSSLDLISGSAKWIVKSQQDTVLLAWECGQCPLVRTLPTSPKQ
jgi:hypothetical protein